MENPKKPFAFQSVWYFYSEEEIDQTMIQKISEAYIFLSINLSKPIISHPKQLKKIFQSPHWALAEVNKIVIFDLAAKKHETKQALLNDNADEHLSLEIKKIEEIQITLGKQNQRKEHYFYNSIENLYGYINKALQQMKFAKKGKEQQVDLMPINQKKWEDNIAFTLKFFASISERKFFEPNAFGKIKDGYLKEYLYNKDFRNYMIKYQKDLHLKDNCEEIGFQLKEIYNQIKFCRTYEQYVQGWKLFITDEQQLSLKKHDNLYMHKTFGVYHSSLEQIIKKETISPQTKLIAFKMILRNRGFQEWDYSVFNHGFAIVDNKIIVNCMTLFRLIKITPILYKVRSYSQDIFHFELISFDDFPQLGRPLGKDEHSQYIQFFSRFLKKKKYENSSLQEAYIKNGQFQLATSILDKKKSRQISFYEQLNDKLVQRQRQFQRFGDQQRPENILKVAQLYKVQGNNSYYISFLKKYITKVQNNSKICPFEMYIQRGKILIELSLNEGLGGKCQNTSFIFMLKTVKQIILYLGSIFTYLFFQEQKKKRINKYLYFFSCCNFFTKASGLSAQIIQQYDQRMEELLFPQLTSVERPQLIAELKLRFILLFQDYRQAIIQLYRFGYRSSQFRQIKDSILQLQRYSVVIRAENQSLEQKLLAIYQQKKMINLDNPQTFLRNQEINFQRRRGLFELFGQEETVQKENYFYQETFLAYKTIIITKAKDFQQKAKIYYQQEIFKECIKYAQLSLQLYRRIDLSKMSKVYLDLKLMRIQAIVKKLADEETITNFQVEQVQEEINSFKQFLLQGSVYQVELDLVKVQILELYQNTEEKYQTIINLYKIIEQKRSQFYDQNQISSITMYVNIILVHHSANKMKECKSYLNKIINAFENPVKSESRIIESYKWMKYLAVFFQQLATDSHVKLLHAKQSIELCLQEIKAQSRQSSFLYKIHRKIREIYQKFNNQKLKFFCKNPKNMQSLRFQEDGQVNLKKQAIPQIQSLDSQSLEQNNITSQTQQELFVQQNTEKKSFFGKFFHKYLRFLH